MAKQNSFLRSCPKELNDCFTGLGEYRGSGNGDVSGCSAFILNVARLGLDSQWTSVYHHVDICWPWRNSHSSLQIYRQKGWAFHFMSYFPSFYLSMPLCNYSIIYISTGCHENNCKKCFPHGRSEKILVVHFWIAQKLIRPTNISILTGSLKKTK